MDTGVQHLLVPADPTSRQRTDTKKVCRLRRVGEALSYLSVAEVNTNDLVARHLSGYSR
jgi:hypothetical protein